MPRFPHPTRGILWRARRVYGVQCLGDHVHLNPYGVLRPECALLCHRMISLPARCFTHHACATTTPGGIRERPTTTQTGAARAMLKLLFTPVRHSLHHSHPWCLNITTRRAVPGHGVLFVQTWSDRVHGEGCACIEETRPGHAF